MAQGLRGGYSRLHFFWHYVANKILTLLTKCHDKFKYE